MRNNVFCYPFFVCLPVSPLVSARTVRQTGSHAWMCHKSAQIDDVLLVKRYRLAAIGHCETFLIRRMTNLSRWFHMIALSVGHVSGRRLPIDRMVELDDRVRPDSQIRNCWEVQRSVFMWLQRYIIHQCNKVWFLELLYVQFVSPSYMSASKHCG